MTSENAEKPEHNACASKNAKTDWDSTNTNTSGVVPIDVECLCGPEHDDREEVGAANRSDDQRESKNSGLLLETRRKHWELRTLDLPDGKSDQEGCTEQQWYEDVSRFPGVLISTPLKTAEEENHSNDAEETADEVDLADDLLP